jgi:hypothetical protein
VKVVLLPVLAGILMLCSYSMADVPPEYRWNKWILEFNAGTPPAYVILEDAQGRRAGANPKLPFNEFGEQGNSIDGLKEIPFSSVEQQNIGSDDPATEGQSQSATGWFVHIYDQPAQTFTMHLVGLKDGVERIYQMVMFGPKRVSDAYGSNFDVLVLQGSNKTFQIVFDPEKKVLAATPVLNPGDLKDDVKAACGLSFITSGRVCKDLMEKASDIQDALEHHCNEKAEALIQSFLYSLGDSRPKECKDNDDHPSIKEPALTSLKTDAHALLDSLKKDGRHWDERDCREEDRKNPKK